MVTEIKKWGKWQLQGASLVIFAPSDYQYRIPVADLKSDRITKIWLSQLSVKPWVSVEDLFDFKRAARELNEAGLQTHGQNLEPKQG